MKANKFSQTKLRYPYVFSLLGLLFISETAWSAADCQTSASPGGCPFLVQATVQNGCLVTGGTSTSELGALSFGTYPAISKERATASLVANTQFKLNCTPNMSLTMSIDAGLHYGTARNVQQSNGNRLAYQLFSNASFTNAIGINQAVTISNVGTGSNITLPVYATLQLPGSGVRPGTYQDTLTVTLTW